MYLITTYYVLVQLAVKMKQVEGAMKLSMVTTLFYCMEECIIAYQITIQKLADCISLHYDAIRQMEEH